MSGNYFIEADGKMQFLPNYGHVGGDVILTPNPAVRCFIYPPLVLVDRIEDSGTLSCSETTVRRRSHDQRPEWLIH